MEVVHVGPSGGPLTARDTWSSIFADAAPQMIFISWEPPPPSFLKVNFDGCVLDCGARGGVGFVIRGPNSYVVAAGGSQIFHTSVPGAELRAAWAGLHHARRLLGATAIVLEGDSATVIGWIRGRPGTAQSQHPLLRDIWRMTSADVSFEAHHIYREANGAADWMASYAAHHSGEVTWTDVGTLPRPFVDLVFADSLGCFHSRCIR